MKTIGWLIILMALFPFAGRAASVPSWSCDVHAFQYDMSVYLSVENQGLVVNENKIVAVFCGEECRGVAELQDNGGKASYFYLRVRSNALDGETLSIRVYDEKSDKVLSPSAVLPFQAQAQIGYPSAPFVVVLPQVITPDNLDQISQATTEIVAEGEWDQEDLGLLSEQISNVHGNERLEMIDLEHVEFQSDVTMEGVFSGCEHLTTVILPNLNGLPGLSEKVFEEVNPNCIVYLPVGSSYPEKWSESVNIVVGDQTECLNLFEHNPFYVKKTFTAQSCLYQRSFGSSSFALRSQVSDGLYLDGWETLCLPFPVDKVKSNDKELKPIGMVDGTLSGDYYRATLGDAGFEILDGIVDYYFKQNIPYLINMTSADGQLINGNVDFICTNPVVIDVSVNNGNSIETLDYSFVGVFEEVEKKNGIFALNDEGNVFINNRRNVFPFEAYMTVVDKDVMSIPISGVIPVAEVEISPSSATIKVGETIQLAATVRPIDASESYVVTWSSENDGIATVSPSGLVTGIKEGTLSIFARVGNLTASCIIKVEQKENVEPPIEEVVPVTGVSLMPSSLELIIGETYELELEFTPVNASDQSVIWYSEDDSVAVVDQFGEVRALKEGETFIVVTTNDGKYEARCEVIVKSDPTGIDNVINDDIQIYPTCVNQSFMVSGIKLPATIHVVSIRGKIMRSYKVVDTEIYKVDVSGMPKGVYIVVFGSGNISRTFKIVKE